MRSSLSDEQKDRLVELLIHEREQAARMRLERAQQLIELMEVDPTRVDHASSG